jgi:hypothetical protein
VNFTPFFDPISFAEMHAGLSSHPSLASATLEIKRQLAIRNKKMTLRDTTVSPL